MPRERKQLRVNIWDDDQEQFAALAQLWEMNDTQLASMLISAAVRAIRENEMRAELPLRLEVSTPYSRASRAPSLLNDERVIKPSDKAGGARRS